MTELVKVVHTSETERALLIERYNRLVGRYNRFNRRVEQGINRLDAVDEIGGIIHDQQQVLALLIDILADTTKRPD